MQSAERADRDDTRANALFREQAQHRLEPGAMAAHDREIGRLHVARQQGHGNARAFRQPIGESFDREETVGLREARDRTRAFAEREGFEPGLIFAQRHHREFGAAEIGRDRDGSLRFHDRLRARRKAAHAPQHRHDKIVEGEHRRSRKSRQHDNCLTVDNRKTERLAGFQRDAMRNNAGLAEVPDNVGGKVAGAFRCAAG